MWDPHQYRRYARERSRPFVELVSRVGAEDPSTVVDLGCGPGDLTASLAGRWPAARILAVDSSAEMLESARAHTGVEFVHGDLCHWKPDEPVDVLLSNATLQWVPGHLDLLGRLVDAVAPGGWFAFQVPGNFGEPSHRILHELQASPRWSELVGDVGGPSSHEPADYLERLAHLGCTVDVWETTYMHVLHGRDAVLEWVKGTALRPVLAHLGDDAASAFLAEYAGALRDAYPASEHGTLFPFRRIFVVAQTPA